MSELLLHVFPFQCTMQSLNSVLVSWQGEYKQNNLKEEGGLNKNDKGRFNFLRIILYMYCTCSPRDFAKKSSLKLV